MSDLQRALRRASPNLLEIALRRIQGSPSAAVSAAYLAQPNWEIDPVTGNNGNSGLPGHPLRTHAEYERRIGHGNTLDAPRVGGISTTTIKILNSLPPSDPVNLVAAMNADSQVLYVTRAPTVIATGTLTGVTPISRAAGGGNPFIITDTAVADWTPFVGMRIRITGGPRAGTTAFIALNVGGHSAWTSSFCVNPAATPTTLNDPLVPTPPQAGDPYAIEDLVQMTPGYIQLISGRSSSLVETSLSFFDVHWPVAPLATFSLVIDGIHHVNMVGSIIEPTSEIEQGQWFFENCCFPGGGGAGGFGDINLNAGCALGVGASSSAVAAVDSEVFLDLDFLVVNNPVQIFGNGTLVFGTCGIFNGPGAGVELGANLALGGAQGSFAVRTINDVTHALYGNGNATVGVAIGAGCIGAYATDIPTITGAGGDFTLGGAATARAFDEVAGAYTALIACTWANVAIATPAGFGGNAHNVTANANLVQAT